MGTGALSCLTQKTGIDEQRRALKDMTDKNNIHLTSDGHNSLANGITGAIKKSPQKKGSCFKTCFRQ
jgi:hypothetical protein